MVMGKTAENKSLVELCIRLSTSLFVISLLEIVVQILRLRVSYALHV